MFIFTPFCIIEQKLGKKMTIVWGGQHPNDGQNIRQINVFKIWDIIFNRIHFDKLKMLKQKEQTLSQREREKVKYKEKDRYNLMLK